MGKNTEEKKNGKDSIAIVLIIVLMIITAVLGTVIFKLQIDNRSRNEADEDQRTYDRYYAFIAADEDSAFWKAVYIGAKEAGERSGSYVEDFASDLAMGYTPAERVEIAIASGVDGIIAEGGGNSAFKNALKEATKQGIPVVLMGNDDSGSGRISFVGVSRYDLGTVYGKQAAELSKQLLENQDKVRVRVLISKNADANAQNLLISAIRETLLSDGEIRGKIALTTYAINDTGTFASQESVKDMFDKQEDIPDILIALSEDHTNSAYQAVLDYNLAGQCNIIGYYDSDSIRNAIENEVIYSTVKTEATQMGAYCTQAMDEYKDAGYVSEFYAVDTNVMNKDNLPAHKEVSE